MATTKELTVRPYREGDLPDLVEIDAEFQHESGFGLGDPDRPLFPHLDMDDIDAVYTNSGGAFWIIEAPDSEIAGFGGVLRVDDETTRLRRFRIASAWRRQGLATRLLEQAEAFCRERGYRRVTLGTNEKNTPAQTLYKRHGYIRIGEHTYPNGEREIEFEKVLS